MLVKQYIAWKNHHEKVLFYEIICSAKSQEDARKELSEKMKLDNLTITIALTLLWDNRFEVKKAKNKKKDDQVVGDPV